MVNSPYKFDLTGVSPDNHIPNEIHTVEEGTARLILLEAGLFYTKSVVLRLSSNGSILTEDLDYGFSGFNPELTAVTTLSIAESIYLKNKDISGDFTVTYQAVGGDAGNAIFTMQALTQQLEQLGDKQISWHSLRDVPEFFPSLDKSSSVLDLTELDIITQSIQQIGDALIDSRHLPNSLKELRTRIDRALAIIGVQRNDINKLGAISSEMRMLSDQFTTINTAITDLTETISYIDPSGHVDLTDINSKVNSTVSQLSTLATLITENENSINSLNLLDTTNDITALNDQLNTLSTQVQLFNIPTEPYITYPLPQQHNTPLTFLIKSNPFVSSTQDTHEGTELEIATDYAFTEIAYTRNSNTELTEHLITEPLNKGTTYYLRLRYKGTVTGFSPWSVPIVFTTLLNYNTVNLLGGSYNDVYNGVCANETLVAVGYSEYDSGVKGMVVTYDDALTVERSVGVGGIGETKLNQCIALSNGDIIAVGTTTSFGGIGVNGYIVKLNKNLSIITERVVSGSGTDSFLDLTLHNNELIVVGQTSSLGVGPGSTLIMKLTLDLNVLNSRLIHTDELDVFNSVTVGHNNEIVAVGSTTGFNNGNPSALLVRFNSDLTQIEASTLNDLNLTHITYRDNNYYAVGELLGGSTVLGCIVKLSSDLQPLITRSLTAGSTISLQQGWVGTDDSLLAVGYGDGLGVGDTEALLIKMDTDLNLINMKLLGGTLDDGFMAVTLTDDDQYVVVGHTLSSGAGQYDALLLSTTTDLFIVPGIVPEVSDLRFSNLGLTLSTVTLTHNVEIIVGADATLDSINPGSVAINLDLQSRNNLY